MENLERLHERTNVSLKLPEGGRLRLQPTSELKGKQGPANNFNIEPTHFSDENPASSYAILDQDDDDDLPGPYEPLKTPKSFAKPREPSPETAYSDAEIDSLIRHAPLYLMEDQATQAAFSPRPSKQDTSKRVQKPLSLTPLSSRKRNQSSVEVFPPKRPRFELGGSQGFFSSPASISERVKVRNFS
jgi:hypothetical protein